MLDTRYMCAYIVCVNVTRSIVRDYLEEIASERTTDEILEELEHLWRTSIGDSSDRSWTRESLHERAGVRCPSILDGVLEGAKT